MGINDYYEHGIARGVVRFTKEAGWKLSGYGWMFGSFDDIRGWEGDGIITRIESEADADIFASLDKPVVDVAGAYSSSAFHQVNNDDYLTGKEAGLHLRERGFINYAFCGVENVGWSEKRKSGFIDSVAGAGEGDPPVFERSLEWWEMLSRSDSLNEWLQALPLPGAVFACNDTAGVKITSVCRKLGIPVPEGLAILGVDNEDILCELAQPTLSSVQLDCEEIGYRAAGLLESLLGRRNAGSLYTSEFLIRPKGITERESTRIFVSSDTLISDAVNFIRTSSQSGMDVADVASHVNVSRRTLETRFRKVLDRTVHDEIILSRIGFAEKRLISSDITIEAAALEAGFGSIQRFHAGFKAKNGITPGEFRKKNRRG
jgi:LacI family transcriptional regulator